MHGFYPLTYLSVLGDGAGVNLEDVQASLLIRQFNVWNREEGIFSDEFRLSKKNDHSLFLVGNGSPYGFYGRACQAAAGPGPGCRVCWWP